MCKFNPLKVVAVLLFVLAVCSPALALAMGPMAVLFLPLLWVSLLLLERHEIMGWANMVPESLKGMLITKALPMARQYDTLAFISRMRHLTADERRSKLVASIVVHAVQFTYHQDRYEVQSWLWESLPDLTSVRFIPTLRVKGAAPRAHTVS